MTEVFTGRPESPEGRLPRELRAYDALDALVNHEWKTKLVVRADESSCVRFRGFRGRYRLSWKDAKGLPQTRFVDVK